MTFSASKNIFLIMLEERRQVIDLLKTVFDPELGINVYDLGLVYGIDVNKDYQVHVIMTLTSPTCPFADALFGEIREKIENLEWVKDLNIEVTFEPMWATEMMSEEAMLEAGLL